MAKAKSFTEKIKITGYDELFGGSAGGKCDAEIREIPLADLRPFQNHPFKVKDDEAMEKLAESIKENGVLVPAMARPLETGGYELISGHRRKRAAELAGLPSMRHGGCEPAKGSDPAKRESVFLQDEAGGVEASGEA